MVFVCVFVLQHCLSCVAQKHTNAAQSLCDIIRLSRDRDQMSQVQDESASDTLLQAIEK